jgi:hypothetical protein
MSIEKLRDWARQYKTYVDEDDVDLPHLEDLTQAVEFMENVLEKYRSLHDGLSDMVESGRLTENALPDDYGWLVETLADLAVVDAKVKESYKLRPLTSSALDVREHPTNSAYYPPGAIVRRIRAVQPEDWVPETFLAAVKEEAEQRGWTLAEDSYAGRGWDGVLAFLHSTYHPPLPDARPWYGVFGVVNFKPVVPTKEQALQMYDWELTDEKVAEAANRRDWVTVYDALASRAWAAVCRAELHGRYNAAHTRAFAPNNGFEEWADNGDWSDFPDRLSVTALTIEWLEVEFSQWHNEDDDYAAVLHDLIQLIAQDTNEKGE